MASKNNWPLPLLCSHDYPSIRIDPYVEGAENNIKKDVIEDVYQRDFFGRDHSNFIATEPPLNDSVVISVMNEPVPGTNLYNALKTTKKGYQELQLEIPPDLIVPIIERQEKVLVETQKECKNIYPVVSPSFPSEFSVLEEKHSQKRIHMKLGIVYCRKNQVSPQEMFRNGQDGDKVSVEFQKFIEFMGRKIDLEGWLGYLGDMKPPGFTYYDQWQSVEVIYHVGPILNAEGHRRLIGNDIAVMFFLDEGADTFFNPSEVSKFGTVPQVFAVIQPSGPKYRVAFFCNNNIKKFGPDLPKMELDPYMMKDLVLTKLFNGLVMANYCPPMNRLFYVPRKTTLDNICQQYPPESKKERKEREKRLRKDMKDRKEKEKEKEKEREIREREEKEEKEKQDRITFMQQQQQIQQQFLNQGQGGTFQPVNELLEGTEVTFENTAEDYSHVNSLVLLMASNTAYLDDQEDIRNSLSELGFEAENVARFEKPDIKGYIAADDHKIIVSFASTTFNLTQLAMNLKNWQNFPKKFPGNFHRGTCTAVSSIWDDIVFELMRLQNNDQKIWICGHGFGGSVATVIAFLLMETQRFTVAGLYTYGSPKIGDEIFSKNFNKHLLSKCFRVVLNNDIVPYLGPRALNWRNVGTVYFIKADGTIQKDYRITTPQTSSSAHLVTSYFAALLPLHRIWLESHYSANVTHRDRFYTRDLKIREPRASIAANDIDRVAGSNDTDLMNLAEGDFGDDGDVSESERSLGGGKPLPRVPLIKRIENSKGAQSADFLRPGTSKQGLFTRNKASPSAAPLPVGYPTAGNPPIITAPSKRPVPREKRRSKSMTQDDIDKIREHMGKEPVPAEMKRSSQNSEMDFDNVNAFPAGKPSGGSAGKSLGSKIAAFLGSDSDSSRRKSARGIMPTVDSSRTARPVGHPQLRRSKSFNTLAVEKSFRDQMTEDSVGDSRPLPQTATAQKADNGRFFPRPSSRLPASAQAASSASAYSTLPNKSFGDADSAKNTNSIPEENPAEQQESGYPKRESFRNRALPVTKNTYSNTSSPSTDLVLTNKNLVQVAERGGLRRSKSFSGVELSGEFSKFDKDSTTKSNRGGSMGNTSDTKLPNKQPSAAPELTQPTVTSTSSGKQWPPSKSTPPPEPTPLPTATLSPSPTTSTSSRIAALESLLAEVGGADALGLLGDLGGFGDLGASLGLGSLTSFSPTPNVHSASPASTTSNLTKSASVANTQPTQTPANTSLTKSASVTPSYRPSKQIPETKPAEKQAPTVVTPSPRNGTTNSQSASTSVPTTRSPNTTITSSSSNNSSSTTPDTVKTTLPAKTTLSSVSARPSATTTMPPSATTTMQPSATTTISSPATGSSTTRPSMTTSTVQNVATNPAPRPSAVIASASNLTPDQQFQKLVGFLKQEVVFLLDIANHITSHNFIDANNFQSQFADIDDHAIVSIQQRVNTTANTTLANKEKLIAEFTRFSKISPLILQHSKLYQNKSPATAQKFLEVFKLYQNSLSNLKILTQ